MESAIEQKKTERLGLLENWLKSVCSLTNYTLQPMVGDASFRRYFRLFYEGQSFVVMDAPPEQEDCHPYVAVSHALRELGLKTPDILHADMQMGFLLITDFGDATYLKTLNQHNVDELYGRAFHALTTIQTCHDVPQHALRRFDEHWMQQEWQLHQEWFTEKWLGLTLSAQEKNDLNNAYAYIVRQSINQPYVFTHRDYHSANLMVLSSDVGILDFQDAFFGPITYDLVSLLRDCYIDWSQTQVKTWALAYYAMLEKTRIISPELFLQGFDAMGMQRHLKALMTFARKHVRDQHSQYLQHVPRTLNYLIDISRHYPACKALHRYAVQAAEKASQLKQGY